MHPRAMDTTTKEKLMSEQQSTDPAEKARILSYVKMVEEGRIARDVINGVIVSTLWVGFNPNTRHIETMILGGEFDGCIVERRYAGEADARRGHQQVVTALLYGREPEGLTPAEERSEPAVSYDPDAEAACCDHYVSSHYTTGCWADRGSCRCKLTEDEARAAVAA